jgi:tetratricopeptide (TPR) repeat protein
VPATGFYIVERAGMLGASLLFLERYTPFERSWRPALLLEIHQTPSMNPPSTRKAIAALALLVLVCGCATFQVAGFSSHNTWSIVTTTHFVVYTDLDERTAGKAAAELEATRDVLISATWPGSSWGQLARTHVYVLATGDEYQRIFGPDLHGLFAPGQRPALYIHAPVDAWSSKSELLPNTPVAALRHEMAHQLVAAAVGPAPIWLEEGLAQFLETARVADDGRSLVLGGTNRRSRSHFLSNPGVTLRSTLAWKEPAFGLSDSKLTGLSGTSYVFVHWLFTQRTEAFARYLRALSEHVDPKKAWDAAFAEFDPDVVGQTLVEYARGELPSIRRSFSPGAASIEIRGLDGPDARVARAQTLYAAARFASGSVASELEAQARREVKDAREAAPTLVEALALDTSSPGSERLLFAHEAAVRAPQDPRVFALIGSLSPNFVDQEQAYRRALALHTEDPKIFNDFALLLLSRDRTKDALPIVEEALRRAPDDLDIIDTYADTLFRLRRCSDALQQQLRALHRAREADRGSLRRMTQLYEQRKVTCGEPESAWADAQLSGTGVGPSPTQASPDAEGPTESPAAEPRSGVSVGVTVGVGYATGSYESTEYYGDSSVGSLAGLSLDVNVAVGYWVAPAFTLGLEGGYLYQVLNEGIVRPPTTTTWDSQSVLHIGPLVGWYASPSRLSSFHLQAGIAYALSSMKGEVQDSVFGTKVIAGENMSGYFLHTSVGYAWRVLGASVGPGLRLHYGSLQGESSSASLGGVLVVGNVLF